jgi:AcrR family transcriptional regulator
MALPRPKPGSTKEQILGAARTVLQQHGGGGLSTRSVAEAAGVNLSLIHYHFRSREGLLLAVLDEMNAELLNRQRRLYGRSDLSLSAKWRRAVEFYRADLRSGYVRVLLELAAEGYANPQIAHRVRAAIGGWRDLLTDTAAETLPRFGITAIEPRELATIVVSAWYGMELQHQLGVAEKEGWFIQTLDTIGHLIEQLERRPISVDMRRKSHGNRNAS